MQIAQTYDSRYTRSLEKSRNVNERDFAARNEMRGLDRPAGRKFAFSRPDTRTAGARYREIYMPTRSPDRRGAAPFKAAACASHRPGHVASRDAPYLAFLRKEGER